MIVVKYKVCHVTHKLLKILLNAFVICNACHMSISNITSCFKEPLMRRVLVYFRFDQLSLKILRRLYTKYALVSPRKILICTFNGINFMEVEQNNNFKQHDFLFSS